MTPRGAAALVYIVALAFVFAVVLPRREKRRLTELRTRIANDPGARFQFYLRYLAFALLVVEAYVLIVLVGGEGFEAAGALWTNATSLRLFAGVYTGIIAAGLVIGVTRLVGERFDPAAFDPEKQLERVEFLVPSTRRENAMWALMSFAIGLLEELLYRGLFVLYTAAVLGVSPWWLVLPSTVIFALNHRYQGWFGVVATGALGVGFTIMSIVSGSLWPAIVLHAAFDYRLKSVRRRVAKEVAKKAAVATGSGVRRRGRAARG